MNIRLFTVCVTRKLISCQQRYPEHLEPIKIKISHQNYQTISLFCHNNLCIKSTLLRFRINKEIKHKSMLLGGYKNLSLLHRVRLLITELLLNTIIIACYIQKLQRVILARHLHMCPLLLDVGMPDTQHSFQGHFLLPLSTKFLTFT